MQRVAIWACLLAGAVSCSGTTTERPGSTSDGEAGTGVTSGSAGATSGAAGSASGGATSSGAGGVASTGGANQGGANTAGAGGTNTAGAGGTNTAGAAGMTTGGTPTGALAGGPATGAAWDVPTGDPLNSTPPVLARLGTGFALAGASADPKTVGLDAFATGVKSEAFLASLDHQGKAAWRHPLLPAGLPNAVAVNAAQEIVVLAPYLPDLETVSPFTSGDSVYLGKFAANGTPIFEKELKFDSGTRLYALALAADGSIWVGGAQTSTFPNESMALAKYDATGKEQFFKLFPCDGSTCYVTGLSVTASGDVVLCGVFNASLNLGGDTLATAGRLGTSLMPNGFAARFDSSGKHVWSQRLGGPIFDLANAVTALPDGDIVLAGLASGAATIGGQSVMAEESMGQAFVARLDPGGKARWVELSAGMARASALQVDGETLHVAGNFDTTAYVQHRALTTGKLLDSTRALSGSPYATATALDGVGSLWVAGSYMDSLALGNSNQLSAASGVFLLRLDQAP